MFPSTASSIPMCTVRRHPSGGYTPVLHLPEATPPDQAVQYARNHYGTDHICIAAECRTSGELADPAVS
jgi:hypothetical protein